MFRVFWSVMAMAGLISGGCTTVVKQTVPFIESDFEPFMGTGTSSIVGSAFLKTRSGDVEVAAAEVVELIPSTPYTRERFEFAVAPSKRLEPRDRRLDRHIRRTVADARGNFGFREVPAGDYFVVCTITWDYAATRYGAVQSSRRAVASVHVEEGQLKRVVLTE